MWDGKKRLDCSRIGNPEGHSFRESTAAIILLLRSIYFDASGENGSVSYEVCRFDC